MDGTDRALSLLDRLTAEMGSAGEVRDGQRTMCAAVAAAIDTKRHLVVQAGTGTGKSLAYLAPIVASGRKTVIATATKALQDQLAEADLPFVAEHGGRPFTFAVLKGRSNYLCRQRLDELDAGFAAGTEQKKLPGVAGTAPSPSVTKDLAAIRKWAATTAVGDRAELAVEPSIGVGRGQRRAPGVSGRGEVSAGRRLLRRVGSTARCGRRCHRRQHPPLRPAPGGGGHGAAGP